MWRCLQKQERVIPRLGASNGLETSGLFVPSANHELITRPFTPNGAMIAFVRLQLHHLGHLRAHMRSHQGSTGYNTSRIYSALYLDLYTYLYLCMPLAFYFPLSICLFIYLYTAL